MGKYASDYMTNVELRGLLFRDLDYFPESGRLFWNKPSPRRKLDQPVGTLHSSGYLIMSVGVNSKVYSLRVHRVCWLLYYKTWPNGFVDHVNRDKEDNSIENLRLATDQQNAQNSTLSTTNKSGYRGVSWSDYHKRWVARIGIGGGKHKFLGYFKCTTAAALAYDRASLKYHKEFGVRNFL